MLQIFVSYINIIKLLIKTVERKQVELKFLKLQLIVQKSMATVTV